MDNAAFMGKQLPLTSRRNSAAASQARPRACAQCVETKPKSKTSTAPPRRRQISDEAKTKISKALKGRTITETHRSRISASLSGANNPRYGQRVSEETRKRIGAAVAAAASARRKAKEDGMKDHKSENSKVPPEQLPVLEKQLREKAARSPLLGDRRVNDEDEAAVDALLQRVRDGGFPPDAVKRAWQSMVPVKQAIVQTVGCPGCRGTGSTECTSCVGRFGTVSMRCGSCFGAGYSFCKLCHGTGVQL